MADFRACMTPEQGVNCRVVNKGKKMATRNALAFEEKEKKNTERKEKYKNSNRIQAFKTQITKGPFYICVICNRAMYKSSVQLFLESKYDETLGVVFMSRVQSFDNHKYICKTCHSKLLKKKIPAQAVCNDMRICDVPERFSDIRKLEKIIISKRILFKKVTIMSKGQAPKMKGAICNVPIDAANICNVLPRGMDNNGVVRVALKKKMSFKSNVYFQPVRPNFINEILLFLKNANPLYSDIEIQLDAIPSFWINTINNNDSDDDEDEEDNEIDFVNESTSSKNETEAGPEEEEDPNPLDNFRVSASETAFVPELSYQVIDDSNITIAPGENKEPLPVICDEDCEMLAHPFLSQPANSDIHIQEMLN